MSAITKSTNSVKSINTKLLIVVENKDFLNRHDKLSKEQLKIKNAALDKISEQFKENKNVKSFKSLIEIDFEIISKATFQNKPIYQINENYYGIVALIGICGGDKHLMDVVKNRHYFNIKDIEIPVVEYDAYQYYSSKQNEDFIKSIDDWIEKVINIIEVKNQKEDFVIYLTKLYESNKDINILSDDEKEFLTSIKWFFDTNYGDKYDLKYVIEPKFDESRHFMKNLKSLTICLGYYSISDFYTRGFTTIFQLGQFWPKNPKIVDKIKELLTPVEPIKESVELIKEPIKESVEAIKVNNLSCLFKPAAEIRRQTDEKIRVYLENKAIEIAKEIETASQELYYSVSIMYNNPVEKEIMEALTNNINYYKVKEEKVDDKYNLTISWEKQ